MFTLEQAMYAHICALSLVTVALVIRVWTLSNMVSYLQIESSWIGIWNRELYNRRVRLRAIMHPGSHALKPERSCLPF